MREFEVKQKVVFSMLNVNCLSINNYCCVFVVICTFADCCLIFDVHKKIAQVCVMVLLRHHVIWPFMFKALTLWIFFFGGVGEGVALFLQKRERIVLPNMSSYVVTYLCLLLSAIIYLFIFVRKKSQLNCGKILTAHECFHETTAIQEDFEWELIELFVLLVWIACKIDC